MVSAILSLILGVLSFGTVPVVLPVFGLMLGTNALLKEKKKENQRKSIQIMAIIGLILNGLMTVLFILGGFVKR